ncbi:hypothetical protein Ga0100230_012980 [Opitutaceae bacterium TAV3]|nr:hypothetical protein Ga0100230_012980 [Opitutaceae bacterium TAV3]
MASPSTTPAATNSPPSPHSPPAATPASPSPRPTCPPQSPSSSSTPTPIPSTPWPKSKPASNTDPSAPTKTAPTNSLSKPSAPTTSQSPSNSRPSKTNSPPKTPGANASSSPSPSRPADTKSCKSPGTKPRATPPPPPPPPHTHARSENDTTIANEHLTVSANPGQSGIDIHLDGRPLLAPGGLHALTLDDPYGAWGNHDGEREGDDISTVLATWTIAQTRVLETGPLRATLWVMLTSGASRLELSLSLAHRARHIHVTARLLWNERSARLKLVFPGAGDTATFEIPGGEITRSALGEVPGGRWVRTHAAPATTTTTDRRPLILASDAFYNFDLKNEALRATVVRSTRYARNSPSRADEDPWRPHQDLGEHCFQFALGSGELDPWRLADQLEQPVLTLAAPPHNGPLGRTGSLAALEGQGLRLLALKPALDANGWIVRIQNLTTTTIPPLLTWLDSRHKLDPLVPFEIASWRLTSTANRWIATRVTTAEEPVPSTSAPPVTSRHSASRPDKIRHLCPVFSDQL